MSFRAKSLLALSVVTGSAAAIGGGYYTAQKPAATAVKPATTVAATKTLINSLALSATTVAAANKHLADIDTGLLRDMQKAGTTGLVGLFVHFSDKDTGGQDLQIKGHSLTVVTDFRKYTDAIFVQGSVANLMAMATLPNVYRLEWNEPLQLYNHTANWALRTRVAQERVQDGPYYDAAGNILNGLGIGVAVVDSGVDGRHPDFALALNGGRNYKVTCPVVGTCPTQGYTDLGTTGSSDTSSGHGVHVAGTILGSGAASTVTYTDTAGTPVIKGAFAGVAPGAKLFAYGTGEAISVLFSSQSYQHMLDNYDNRTVFPTPIRVTNNSYGNTGGTAYSASNTLSQLVKRIVTEKNVVVVFAAGNDGDGTTVDKTSGYCKDPTPGVICVASYDDMGTGTRNGVISSFSSQGDYAGHTTSNYPDIAAPGSNITSTCTASLPICKDTNGGDKAYLPNYGTISGTSMATPHTVGVIALLLQARPDLKPADVEKVLQDNARKLVDGTYGATQAAYEDDPQNVGGTINYRTGAGLIDFPKVLDSLSVRKFGSLPASGEYTIISGDGNVTGGADKGSANAIGANDLVKLTMQDTALNGVQGITYRITVTDITKLSGATYVRYQILQNVDGKAFSTSAKLTTAGITADGVGANTNAPATSATVTGNVISLFVPLGSLGSPPVGAPIHNIRINAHSDLNRADAEVDYAPSRTPDTDTQATAPGWGRPYTVLNAATAVVQNRCDIPGITVINDAGGDSMTNSSQDYLSASVAQPYLNSTDPNANANLVFTLKVADLNTLSAGSAYYISFSTPAGFRGVRMEVVNPTAPAFYTYTPSAGQSGATDGRFVSSKTVAATGSKYDAVSGTITIIATPASLGLTAAGDMLTGFNGGVTQSSDPGVGVPGATLVTDEMPNGLGRVGSFEFKANSFCAPNSAPIARLTADKTAGSKALTVAFSGLSSTDADAVDTVASYTFNFGDGSSPVTNTSGKTSHVYSASGTRDATLKVVDSRGLQSVTLAKLTIVTINDAPTVDLRANSTSGNAPFTVDLTAVGADINTGDAASLAYSYDLDGDGSYEVAETSSTTQQATFNTPGTYTLRVKVRDSEGLTGLDDVVITVAEAAKAAADFNFVERVNVPVNYIVTSEPITLTGFGGTLPISAGEGTQYSINGGPFTSASGTVKPGDKLVVRHVSAAAEGISKSTSITVGTATKVFKTTTTTLDHVPDAFDFGLQDGQVGGAKSESMVITPVNYDDAPISAGPGAEYRVNGGSWRTSASTAKKGDTVQARHVSNTQSLGYTKSYIKIGGVVGYYTSRTKR